MCLFQAHNRKMTPSLIIIHVWQTHVNKIENIAKKDNMIENIIKTMNFKILTGNRCRICWRPHDSIYWISDVSMTQAIVISTRGKICLFFFCFFFFLGGGHNSIIKMQPGYISYRSSWHNMYQATISSNDMLLLDAHMHTYMIIYTWSWSLSQVKYTPVLSLLMLLNFTNIMAVQNSAVEKPAWQSLISYN